MNMDKRTLELIKEHKGEPLVIENGKITHEDFMKAYNKFIEKGLVPEFYFLDKDENVIPLLDEPLVK